MNNMTLGPPIKVVPTPMTEYSHPGRQTPGWFLRYSHARRSIPGWLFVKTQGWDFETFPCDSCVRYGHVDIINP